MRLKEKNLLKKFAATLKKFSAQGAKKVEYGKFCSRYSEFNDVNRIQIKLFIVKLTDIFFKLT